jgi:hypothetical protein
VRALGIGLAIGLLIFAISGGHLIFLPLLFVPFGLFRIGQGRRRRNVFVRPQRRRWF